MMRALHILIACAFYFFSGCATSSSMVPLEVSSQPPGGAVEVNGIRKGTTPVTIELSVSKDFVGLANAPGGMAHSGEIFEVTVYPPSNADQSLRPQTKKIVPALTGSKLFFNLELKRPESSVIKK